MFTETYRRASELLVSAAWSCLKLGPRENRSNLEKCEILRAWLRRYPYWCRGHLILGELSLNEGVIATAYASFQACLILQGPPEYLSRARLGLGSCYVRQGDFQRAKQILHDLHLADPGNVAVTEELVACLMGEDDSSGALALINSVAEERLSSSGRVVKRHLEDYAARPES